MVSTDCPSGPREVMTGPFKEFLVPVGDVDKLATAMQSALEQYPDISQLEMERFSADSVASRYLELIKENG